MHAHSSFLKEDAKVANIRQNNQLNTRIKGRRLIFFVFLKDGDE